MRLKALEYSNIKYISKSSFFTGFMYVLKILIEYFNEIRIYVKY